MKCNGYWLFASAFASFTLSAAENPAQDIVDTARAGGASKTFLAALHADEIAEAQRSKVVSTMLREAITAADLRDKAGDAEGCAQTYEKAAKDLLAGGHLRDLHRHELNRLLKVPAAEAKVRAAFLRQGFAGFLSDLAYTVAVEDAFPEGFPAPGLVGQVLVKEYPACRAARASGKNPFMTVYRFITQNAIGMTAPVAMTVDSQLQVKDMAFFFQQPTLGQVGQSGPVTVLDLPAMTVLSVGMRGARTDESIARAKAVLAATLAAHGVTPTGGYRILGYHGPHVPLIQQYWELQIPVISPTSTDAQGRKNDPRD